MLFTFSKLSSLYKGMEEETDTVEDILNFDALGNWRTIKNDDDKYEKVFVHGTNLNQVLKVILRYCFI